MPDIVAATSDAAWVMDELDADGAVLSAHNQDSFVGSAVREGLWQCPDERGTVVFALPAKLPAPPVDGIPAFATDFLLGTTRAAYMASPQRRVHRYPGILSVPSHAGGFVPSRARLAAAC
ncbi:hypothetical protein ACWDZ8_34365 [Streptomyces sp. NPDC003233]